jgi:hypothetical protein
MKGWPMPGEKNKNRKNQMDRSAIKKTYKQNSRAMGIYRITNTGNNKMYIGFGADIQARLNRHKAEMKFGDHRTRELQEAWNESGGSALLFEVLDVLDQNKDSGVDPADELRALAEIWIQKLKKSGNLIERL